MLEASSLSAGDGMLTSVAENSVSLWWGSLPDGLGLPFDESPLLLDTEVFSSRLCELALLTDRRLLCLPNDVRLTRCFLSAEASPEMTVRSSVTTGDLIDSARLSLRSVGCGLIVTGVAVRTCESTLSASNTTGVVSTGRAVCTLSAGRSVCLRCMGGDALPPLSLARGIIVLRWIVGDGLLASTPPWLFLSL